MALGMPSAMLAMLATVGAGAYLFARHAMIVMGPVDEEIAVALEKAGQGLEANTEGVVTMTKACEAIARLGQMWREAEGRILGLQRAVARLSAEVAATAKREREAHAEALRSREELGSAEQTILDLRAELARKGKRR